MNNMLKPIMYFIMFLFLIVKYRKAEKKRYSIGVKDS